MAAPCLADEARSTVIGDDDSEHAGTEGGVRGWCAGLGALARISLPTMLAFTVGARLAHATVIDSWLAGSLGKDDQAAAGLALSLYIPITIAPTGLAGSVNMLSAEAVGAGKPELALEWFALCTASGAALSAACAAALLGVTPLVSLLATDKAHVRSLAFGFTCIMAWSAVGFNLFQCLRAYMQAHGDVLVPTLCAAVGLGVTAGVGRVLTDAVGLQGAGAAYAMAPLVAWLLLCVRARFTGRLHWHAVSQPLLCSANADDAVAAAPSLRRAFSPERRRVAFHQGFYRGALMVLDEAGYAVITVASGHLGVAELAVQGIYYQIWGCFWALQFGIYFGVSGSVAHQLAAGRPGLAVTRCWQGFFIYIMLAAVSVLPLLLARDSVSQMLSTDPDVRESARRHLPALALCVAASAAALCAGAPVDGCGLVRPLAIVTTLGTWLIALPLSLFLCFGPPDMGIDGVWVGGAAGESAKALLTLWLLRGIKWDERAEAAMRRTEQRTSESDPLPGS